MALSSVQPYTYEQRLAACQCIQGFIFNNSEGREGLLAKLIQAYMDEKPDNLLYYLLNLTDTSQKDPYRIWFACIVLLHLLKGSTTAKQMLRQISLGDTSSGEEAVSVLQQLNANISTCLINSSDARIAVGYLMLLCIWLHEDALSVKDFLEESSGIQVLIGTVAQAQERIFVPGLAAVLLGICVEFNSNTSSLPP